MRRAPHCGSSASRGHTRCNFICREITPAGEETGATRGWGADDGRTTWRPPTKEPLLSDDTSPSGPAREGQPAPDFSLPSQTGELVTLEQHRGHWVVPFFYPGTYFGKKTIILSFDSIQARRSDSSQAGEKPRNSAARSDSATTPACNRAP